MKINTTLDLITDHYLKSRDFNGILITNLGKKFEVIRIILKQLLIKEKIILNFGDRHPNPHILALEPEPKEQQLLKLEKLEYQEPLYDEIGPLKIQTNSINCCAYPSRLHLKLVVNPDRYEGKPYTLLLALGEPQLSYKTFNLRVLELYRNDPRYYYQTDDIQGNICVKGGANLKDEDEILIQTFGFAYDKDIKNRYVALFLRYLSDLTPEHQQRWQLEEFVGDTFLHPDYARSTAGEWPERESIFNAFCEELKIINEMTIKITGKAIFRKSYDSEGKPKKFGFLVRPTREEYEAFVHLLDKMLSDNIDKEFFKGKLDLVIRVKKGDFVIEQIKGTIALLDEWLNKGVKLPDPVPKDNMIRVFKEIRRARSKPAHHLVEDEWDSQYFVRQRNLIIEAYQAVRTLRLIFANHHRTRTVKVPDWLFKGEIWTF